jgi:hypothetical protein
MGNLAETKRSIKMKKTLLIVTLLVIALGALGVGTVAAQEGQPPYGQKRGVADSTGLLHDYVEEAMAETVGLTVSAFEARHDAGETFYQIALAEGFTADEIPALMQEARSNALDTAVKDGVISQEQADWMGSRGFGRGGMNGFGGYGNGTCPMCDGDAVPNGGQFGPDAMGGGRGGRWQQNNQ